ncbi:MAG: GIY-YIG nuclease family protein [Bacteroidetes bacterium]|nr:GIY-YIG nuclease family protein [Bacteroidota bacterium]
MWYVYVLKSKASGKFYVGMSEEIERRLAEHNSGKSKFTSGHMPWELVYFEQQQGSVSARKREKYFKTAAGKKFLKRKLGEGSLPD